MDRARGGVVSDAGGWLRDAATPDAWCRGLIVTRHRPSPLAPDGTTTRPEQERKHASAPPAHFNEAQAEQALWKEFHDHGASLNNAPNEAPRIHGGPAWQIFHVHVFLLDFGVSSPLVSPAFVLLLTQFLSYLVRR
jgi:hypothetical protein